MTVTDAVEDAAGVRVQIEPVQDLHGYDHPWPAGGGKNLLDLSGYDAWRDYIINSDGTITVNGSDGGAWDARPIIPLKSGTYTVSYSATSGNLRYKLSEDSYTEEFMTAAAKTFTLTADGGIRFKFGLGASAYPITIKVQLESGSTATAWTPYSNICPISGFEGLTVTRTGKNLLPMQAYKGLGYNAAVGAQFNPTPADHNYVDNGDGTFTISNLASWEQCCLMIPTPVAGNYYLSLTIDGAPTVCISKVNTKDIVVSMPTYLANPLPSSATIAKTETITEPGYLLLYIGSHSTEITITNPICQYDEQITAYEPYAGQTYSITLPTEAGTVYGGELTVNADGSGSLVVDRAVIASYNGESLPGEWISDRDVYASGATPTTGAQVVYELATPLTYTLTASEISTLLGQNNVWSDAGQTALTYTGTDEHLTLTSGKKYLARINGTDSMLLGSGQEITAAKGTDNVFDLTQMFGTAVADYVYGQGAAFFRKWFPNAVYQYNAGELKHVEGLQSHDMVGFNAYNPTTGTAQVVGGQQYQITGTYTALTMNGETITPVSGLFTPAESGTVTVTGGGTDTCIHLAHNNSRNGEYEPYEKHSYPLDSTVILRGIPKVGSNGVYWDGDRYLPDGTVERRYQQRAYESGDESLTNAITDGTYTVVALATPTTETAQPYHSTQWVSDWGTEEFVSTSIVPVGTETRYPANLRDKLQHLPDAASGNGSYLITQTDGQMVLTPFPAPPSSAGNYVLKATVTNGVATYTWEVAT